MGFASDNDDRRTGYNPGTMGYGGSGRTGGNTGGGTASRSGAAGMNAGRSSSTGSSASRGPSSASRAGSAAASASRSTSNSGASRGPSPASRAASAATSASRASDRSGTGFGGLLGSRSGPNNASRAASAQTRGGLLSSAGGGFPSGAMKQATQYGAQTPREHPFRDASRFGYGMGMTPDSLAQGLANRGLLSQLANAQTDFGRRLQINAAHALTGHKEKGAHPLGLAFDVQVPNSMDRGPFIESATRAGFTHTGTYGPGKRGVHIDTRPGMGTWGADTHATSTPGWHRDAVAAGLASGPMDMADVASKIAGSSPTYAGMAPSLANAVQQPKMQDRIAPSHAGLGPGLMASPNVQGPSPAYQNPARSFAGIPDSGFPSYDNPGRSFAGISGQFPAVGAPEAVDQRQMATMGTMVAGRPEQAPSGFPAAPTTDNFPGRPQPSPQFQSQIASRVSQPGGFPPAPQSYQNPGRSFAGIPSSGYPQAQVAQGIPDQPGLESHQPPQQMAEAAPAPKSWSMPSLSLSGLVPDTVKEKAKKAWDNLNNPMLPFAVPPSQKTQDARFAHQQTRQGGPAVPIPGNGPGGQWVGNEAPEQVAAMQQAVVEVLRQYFTNAATPLNQYTTTGGTLAG